MHDFETKKGLHIHILITFFAKYILYLAEWIHRATNAK